MSPPPKKVEKEASPQPEPIKEEKISEPNVKPEPVVEEKKNEVNVQAALI